MPDRITIPEISIHIQVDKQVPISRLIQVRNSEQLYSLTKALFNPRTVDWLEEMILFCLTPDSRIIGYNKLSRGGTTQVICDPKVIFTIALQTTCSSIAIAHNHPMGNAFPSTADIRLTERVKSAGRLLGIPLVDHLIISGEDYYSFKDHDQL